jgi:acetylornithine deacetylase
MNVFELTRGLVDIESITENERQMGDVLFAHLSEMAARHGGHAELIPVEARRNNVLAWWGEPTVTLSTHMDTVPPFFPSREDDQHIWGRGACDTKGIIASMIFAVRDLLEGGHTNLALLFVVG